MSDLLSLVVTGSRHAEPWHRQLIEERLGDIVADWGKDNVWAHVGCARGVDAIATKYLVDALGKHRVKIYHADWRKLGKSAGMARNRDMLQGAGITKALTTPLVAAFPCLDLPSRGTRNCMQQARALGMEVRDFGFRNLEGFDPKNANYWISEDRLNELKGR